MRVRRMVIRVELPAADPARARALVREALTRVAAGAGEQEHGRISRLRVRVDAAAAGDRALAARIARAIGAAVSERARG